MLRDWDYGVEGEQYVCWDVLEHHASGTGIAYCESGFGPRSPWGLVWLEHSKNMSIGMDSGWFTTFLQAYFESAAAADLPIWRVFKTDLSGVRFPMTSEGSWEETWKQVMEHRKEDPASCYDCNTSIVYERE